jgi:two-component system sensor histidine kinase AlgZ
MIGYKELVRRALINTGIAFVAPVLMFAFNRQVTVHRLWVNFQYSLVYAHSIGWLALWAIPKVWGAARKLPTWLQWLLRFVTVFAVAVAGSMLAVLILVGLGRVPLPYYWTELTASLKIALVITALASATISMYESMRSRINRGEIERERALKLATEAQLASLESRIHPHFLFNVLNTISSLIPEDPQRAERLVEQIAALLRFSLDANQSGLVPLSSELKIVADYLEIEKARFGERLRYQIEVAGELNGAAVPPWSVQTLVENSVKHAVAPNRSGGEIRVSGIRENGFLRMEVRDSGPAFRLESAAAGHGLDNLKGRLAALFGGKAALTLERHEDCNSVKLSIPQSEGHASISG